MLKRSLQIALLLSLAAAAHAQTTPAVMETLGVKIGDTSAQIDKVLVGLGYKLVRKEDYAAAFGMPARPQSREYQKLVAKPGSLPAETGYVMIGFGQKSSTAVAIARREQFDRPVSRVEMEKALSAKYGPPTRNTGNAGELEWMALEANSYRPSDSPQDCRVRVGGQVNYGTDFKRLANCKKTVSVILSESSNSGVEFQKIQVSMVDFTAYKDEASALVALEAQQRKDEIEKRRQVPVPKI